MIKGQLLYLCCWSFPHFHAIFKNNKTYDIFQSGSATVQTYCMMASPYTLEQIHLHYLLHLFVAGANAVSSVVLIALLMQIMMIWHGVIE